MLNKLERQKQTLPKGHDKLLLRSCCILYSGEVMETLIESGIDFSIFFIIPIFTPSKIMKSVKKKISVLQKSSIFRLSTTTRITGLNAPKAWKMSQRKASAAHVF